MLFVCGKDSHVNRLKDNKFHILVIKVIIIDKNDGSGERKSGIE